MNTLLDASCRLALAALLHDAGKFAERARLDIDAETSDVNKQLYCPHHKEFTDAKGCFTHIHAAYTGMAIDLIEKQLPELTGDDVSPFASWKCQDADDSLINAAASHHKPKSFLQWVIATADRLASGFEREMFEHYNIAEEQTSTGKNHYTARQLTLFEQITLDGGNEKQENPKRLRWRYPLGAVTVDNLFPQQVSACESNSNQKAQSEYRQLWDAFVKQLQSIPKSHRNQWPLWLDHFDSLWQTFTHAIPSATAGKSKPEVSLYDHSRTTAALAVALWRWHQANGSQNDEASRALKERTDWDENKFLIIMGDFFGIQDFIFASGGETQKKAAKLLRGRSFYVSLLVECAALKILDVLGLPSTSQVISAAGKFLIVAPNTPDVIKVLQKIQEEVNQWFLRYTFGQSGIGLGWTQASCNNFLSDGFASLIKALFADMERTKNSRFGLCNDQAPHAVFDNFLSSFDIDQGVCAIDGRSPAVCEADGIHLSELAADQIDVGKRIPHNERMLITTDNINHATLRLPLFGYYASFTGSEDASGKFGELARNGVMRRAWDYRCPASMDEVLFHGYARRNINAYIPLRGEANAWDADRYRGIEDDADWDALAPKTFEHLARDDWWVNEGGNWRGTEGLVVLKGDVDNLGKIFEAGLARPTFAKWASLSRQMNNFFAIVLPVICKNDFPDTYTVFAGGDDFFLIGPWRSTIKLARRMREEFVRYVAGNPDIHFSAGLLMSKPGLPVRALGEMAEDALECSKSYQENGAVTKDAVTLFGETVRWHELDVLWQAFEQIEALGEKFDLSTGYLYRLQELAWMSENLKSSQPDYKNAIWQSWYAYRTWRMLERNRNISKEQRKQVAEELALGLKVPIDQFGSRFRIPLFLHLYHQR